MLCLVLTNDQNLEIASTAGIKACGHEAIAVSSIMAATALAEELNPRALFVDVELPAARDFIKWAQSETGCRVVAVQQTESQEHTFFGAAANICGPITADKIGAALVQAGCADDAQTSIIDGDLEAKFWDITGSLAPGFSQSDEPGEPKEPLTERQTRNSDAVSVVSQEVIAVWGAKGGEGRTTLALCLAERLHEFDVLLIDLNFTEGPGDIATILDLPVLPHIGRLVDNVTDRRQGFIDSLIKPRRADFAVVQPPPTIDQAESISIDDVVDLIDQARRMFQIVIIDLPNDLSPITLEALDLSTAVLFVSSESIGGLARVEARKSFVRSDTTKALTINRLKNGVRRAREYAHWLEMPLAGTVTECDKGPSEGGKDDFIKYWCEMTYPAVSDILKLLFGLDLVSHQPRRTIVKRIRGAIAGMTG